MTNGGVTHGASELLALISVLTAGKNLECGDLSPLLPLGRLVAKAGPRSAARESRTLSRIRRRQVACGKRGQVRALQRGCGLGVLGNSWAKASAHGSLRLAQPEHHARSACRSGDV